MVPHCTNRMAVTTNHFFGKIDGANYCFRGNTYNKPFLRNGCSYKLKTLYVTNNSGRGE